MPFQYSILFLKRNLDPSGAELYGKTKYNNVDAYDLVNVYETVELVTQVTVNQRWIHV